MRNLLVNFLSNRQGPFATPDFGVNTGFVPATFTPEETAFRHALLLDRTDTDYYLKTAMCALNAYPEILGLMDEFVQGFRPRDVSPRGVEIFGAEFVAPGIFTDPQPSSLPLNFTWIIDYVNTGSVRLTAQDTGVVWTLPAHFNAEILRPIWPAQVPFNGALFVSQPWSVGAFIRIVTEPSRFPFNLWIERVIHNLWLQRLLAQSRLVDEFHGSTEPEEQIAIALAVMVKEHPFYVTSAS